MEKAGYQNYRQIKAVKEYDTFNKTQKIISDFDKEIKKLDRKK